MYLNCRCLIKNMNTYFNYILIAGLGVASIILLYLIISERRKKQNAQGVPGGLPAAIAEISTANRVNDENEQAEINLIENNISDIDKTIRILEDEQKNVEKAVNTSTSGVNTQHARLYSSIYNLSLGVVIMDKDKNIRFMNKTAKTIFKVEEMKTVIDLSGVDKMLANIDTSSRLKDVITEGKSFSYEDIMLDDKQFDIYMSAIKSTDPQNTETAGAIILLKDKTEERLLKRSKENFFIIASHELRTPLTGIRGYIEILKNYYFDKITDAELKRIINDIDASSGRLINIVNDFLDKSKFEEDKISVKLDICDFVPVIISSIKDTELLAKDKKLGIAFENTIAKASVLGDKDKIKQILINLISNSIKYSDRGSINVKLEKTQDEKYKVSISDNGNGIPDENVQYLFSKYQQINTKKGANVVSTGLGLYISKLLAGKMNGDLKLERTKLTEGSTFSLSLPVYHDAS